MSSAILDLFVFGGFRDEELGWIGLLLLKLKKLVWRDRSRDNYSVRFHEYKSKERDQAEMQTRVFEVQILRNGLSQVLARLARLTKPRDRFDTSLVAVNYECHQVKGNRNLPTTTCCLFIISIMLVYFEEL